MKVTVDVDMTPLEARQFMGLPDVQPMQAAAMKEMERRIMTELDRISPEGLMRTWFVDAPATADRLMKMFSGVMSAAAPKPPATPEPAKK